MLHPSESSHTFEKEAVAYHEAGHAIVSMHLALQQPFPIRLEEVKPGEWAGDATPPKRDRPQGITKARIAVAGVLAQTKWHAMMLANGPIVRFTQLLHTDTTEWFLEAEASRCKTVDLSFVRNGKDVIEVGVEPHWFSNSDRKHFRCGLDDNFYVCDVRRHIKFVMDVLDHTKYWGAITTLAEALIEQEPKEGFVAMHFADIKQSIGLSPMDAEF